MLALFQDTAEYEAEALKKAIKGAGTDELCVTEILCGNTNAAVAKVSKAYKGDLVADIKGDFKGHAQALLMSIASVGIGEGGGGVKFCCDQTVVIKLTMGACLGVQGKRKEGGAADESKARKQAQSLVDSAAKWGAKDKSPLFDILRTSSGAQLNAITKVEEERRGCRMLRNTPPPNLSSLPSRPTRSTTA